MTPEIANIKSALQNIKQIVSETEALLADYEKCESELAQKYLFAALKKQMTLIFQEKQEKIDSNV